MPSSMEYDHMSDSDKKKEDWMNTKWRPMMGWMYMAVCTCDFMLFPVLWSIHQAVNHGQVNSQWQPLTLQGAGLFHLAMGAVLGIAAYGRTKEKMAGAENGGLGNFGQGSGTTYVPPNSVGMVNVTSNNTAPTNYGSNNSFNNNSSSSTFSNQQAFGSSNTGFSSGASSFSAPAPSFGTSAPVGSSGKPLGPPQSFPAL